MNLYDEFKWRGMVYDATEGLLDAFARERVTAYIGFDPTASSLHVGSLMTVMALARLQRFGHAPIAIVGGGTGMIGDPSGKSQERVLLSPEKIAENVAGIRRQLERFLDFEPRDGVRDILVRDQAAAVHVGDQAETKARQRRRQFDNGDRRVRQLQLVAFVEVPVRGGAAQRANARGDDPLEHRAPSHRHRLL